MAIAFVQEVALGATPSSSFTLILTLGAVTTTVGNHLVLVDASRSGWSTGIADSKSNTWQSDHVSNGTGEGQTIWSSKLTSALVAADTITITFNNNTAHSAVAAEFSGLATSSWLDQQVGATFIAGTAADSGATGTTSQANELLIGMVGHQSSVTAFTPEVVSPVWNQLSTAASVGIIQQVHPLWRIVAATGTYSTKATWSTSRIYGAAIATYKAAPPAVTGTAVLSGGGTVALLRSSGRAAIVAATGGGTVALLRSSGRRMTIVASGGGVITAAGMQVPTVQLPSDIRATVRDLGPTAVVRDLGPAATVRDLGPSAAVA
jgi:hypothetical protein